MRPVSIDDITAMRLEGDLLQALGSIREDALADCARRRRTVLAHPDLAAQLTAPPCKFPSPEMWTGYIGAEFLPGHLGDGARNDSPYRAQLVGLVAEADRRNARKDAAA